MGVKGLATFIETHRQIYRDVEFRRSRLVVDGCNLLYLLYFSSGLDQNHGGDYAAFKDLVEKFIKALRDCAVDPYVVLDGGTDHTCKKLETQLQRSEDRLRRATQAAAGSQEENVLPQLARMVFTQTLVQLDVPVAQCYAEADQEIAALAREWRCPVLSNDSDFYIFELPGGLLPLSHFQWEAVQRSSSSFIPCKKYNSSSFCAFFGIGKELLPAFAALAGNDYVNLRRMGTPVGWTRFCPASGESPSRLDGLLRWLKDFQTPREAFEAVLGLIGEQSREKQEEVKERLDLGTEEYQLPPSSLKTFFIHGAAPPFPVEELAALVPGWTLLPLMQGRLTEHVLDVLLLQSRSLSLTVEDSDRPSTQLTSRPLRQLMYGLLLGRGKKLLVGEVDRRGQELTVTRVPPVFTKLTRTMTLSSLDEVESSQRLQVLLEALGVTEASLRGLSEELRLPLAATCFWLQRAEPRPDDSLLKALLLGLSSGDALRPRAALQIQDQRFKRKLDVGVAHAFNQWQACLRDSIFLNQLLSFPLPEPQVARLYEGTLVHHLVHLLRTGRLRQLLKYDRSHVKQYKTMLALIQQFRSQAAPTPSEESHKREAEAPQRRRRRRRQPLDDVTTDLQQLFLPYEDDNDEAAVEVGGAAGAQEDLYLDSEVRVRTRYRVKERSNRCQNPELARKQECRGLDLH